MPTSHDYLVQAKGLIARMDEEVTARPTDRQEFHGDSFGGDVEGHLRVVVAHLAAIVGESREENPDLTVVPEGGEAAKEPAREPRPDHPPAGEVGEKAAAPAKKVAARKTAGATKTASRNWGE
jgi:hypothetical protein